jgi:hypothetical protein
MEQNFLFLSHPPPESSSLIISVTPHQSSMFSLALCFHAHVSFVKKWVDAAQIFLAPPRPRPASTRDIFPPLHPPLVPLHMSRGLGTMALSSLPASETSARLSKMARLTSNVTHTTHTFSVHNVHPHTRDGLIMLLKCLSISGAECLVEQI